MRLYHLMGFHYGIQTVRQSRIKVSQIEDLNDPFELLALNLRDKTLRVPLTNFRQTMNQLAKMICFSRSWENPVLWSHYGDKHKGLCLGFDVPDESAIPVRYVTNRESLPRTRDFQFGINLISTKFAHWEYEDECRVFFREDELDLEDEKYFYRLDERIKLREVIAGPRCDVGLNELTKAVEHYPHAIKFTKARLAFTTFKVVRDRRGFPEAS